MQCCMGLPLIIGLAISARLSTASMAASGSVVSNSTVFAGANHGFKLTNIVEAAEADGGGGDVNIGYYFSASCVILGGLLLSLVDVHKKRLRRKRRLRQCKSTASTATAATTTTFNSSTGTIHHHRGLYSSHSQSIDTPKNSGFFYNNDIGGNSASNAKELHSHSEAEVKEDLLANSLGLKDFNEYDEVAVSVSEAKGVSSSIAAAAASTPQLPQLVLVRSHSEAEVPGPEVVTSGVGGKKLKKLMSLELIEHGDLIEADEDDEEDDEDEVYNLDDLDPEELEYLEGITSCNKVENCMFLSEFEQNLIKETSEAKPGLQGATGLYANARGGQKKWYKKKKAARGAGGNNLAPEVARNRSKRWNQVLPGPSKEMATVIEETTSTV